MSKQLWRPTTESDGIPFEVLCGIVSSLNEWRDEHLPRVGVPSDFESEWDLVSAVSACKCQDFLLLPLPSLSASASEWLGDSY